MKDLINKIIDKNKDEIIKLGWDLFKLPELGYKEEKTKVRILEFLKKYNLKADKEYFKTGFEVSLGSGYPHIGLIAELDAIPVLNHPLASEVDNAAHACGHSSQTTIMLCALVAMLKAGVTKNGGRVTLFFTPAEEYTDLEFRKKLISKNEIKYIGGKINMLDAGLFDDVDCFIHLHAMGNSYKYGYGSSLAGFKYKKIIFKGKAAHAGVLPHLGVNALNQFTLFNSGLGMLRETFLEEDMVRVHGILTEGGDTINSVPSRVVYESYIRCLNYDKLLELDKKISDLAYHCAKALSGDVEIENINGYLPFTPNPYLTNLLHKNLLNFVKEEEMIKDEKSIAAGDIGDLSCFKPTIQFGYNGFKGAIHGIDFDIDDEYRAFVEPAKIVGGLVVDLLSNKDHLIEIKKCHKGISKEEYDKYLREDKYEKN